MLRSCVSLHASIVRRIVLQKSRILLPSFSSLLSPFPRPRLLQTLSHTFSRAMIREREECLTRYTAVEVQALRSQRRDMETLSGEQGHALGVWR